MSKPDDTVIKSIQRTERKRLKEWTEATMTRGTILHSPEYLRVSPNLESEREEGDNGAENKFEEIVKISPNLVENTKPHIYESQ